VPPYGTQPKDLVNITLNDPDGGEEVIDGYVLPATTKAGPWCGGPPRGA